MPRIVEVYAAGDILPEYWHTPIEHLLRVHNLGQNPGVFAIRSDLFLCTCIDRRIALKLPNKTAYVLRTAGARLDGNEFELMYAVAVGGVSTVAFIAHTDCGMEHILEKRDEFISGLVERGGAAAKDAAAHFDANAGIHMVDDAVAAVLAQTARVRALLPNVLVAALLYRVENDRLAQIVERP